MSRPLRSLEWLGQRHGAETVACPECEAAPEVPCTNLDGQGELAKLPAHWRRIKKAEER